MSENGTSPTHGSTRRTMLGIGVNRLTAGCNRVSKMDDERLIAALAAGDDGALRELFARHAPWLTARLRRALPVDAVEDVLQETFIAVWRGARRYTPAGKPGAWLWGIAYRQAALWVRTQGGVDTIDIDADGPDVAGPWRDDPASTAATRVDLQRALAALGPADGAQRELARLIFVEDRPVADAAAYLGIPEGTVKSRVFKVRRLLQAALRFGQGG